MSAADRMRSRHLEISFAPDLEQVSVIRRFVEGYYESVLEDADLLGRLTVAVHELLDNAARYSADGECQLRIGITPDGDRHVLSVTVRSTAASVHLDDLKTMVGNLGDVGDPLDAYRRQLEVVSRRTGISALGLARVRGEAEMTLALDFEGRRVCVQAATSFAWKRTPDPADKDH